MELVGGSGLGNGRQAESRRGGGPLMCSLLGGGWLLVMAETSGGGGTEVGFRTRRWCAGGKVMLLRGKRPEEVGVWPLEEAVLPQHGPYYRVKRLRFMSLMTH